MANHTNTNALLFYLKVDELKEFFISPAKEVREQLLAQARQKKRELKLLRSIYLPHMISNGSIDQIRVVLKIKPGDQNTPRTNRLLRLCYRSCTCHLQNGEILVTQFTDPA